MISAWHTTFTTLLLVTGLARSAAIPAAEPEPDHELESRAPMATVYTKCSKANTVALTFDDGPYKYESQLIDFLNSKGVKATFFVNGKNYDCIYNSGPVASLKKARAGGHQIASHTWSHKHLKSLNRTALVTEFSKTDTALQRILGVVPAFMRPPYGEYNNLVREVAKERGQSVVNWDFDSGDSAGKTTSQSNSAYDAIAKKHPSTILTLNHETMSGTVNTVVPHAISVLKAKGYKFATVAECLGGLAPYKSTGTPGTRTADWKC